MTTATKPPKSSKQNEVEAPPRWPADSNEAKAIERVRGWFALTPGPLPPLGGNLDTSAKNRAEMLVRACRGWEASGRRPGYFTTDVIHDHEPLGRTIIDGMKEVIERHGRVAVADAIGEQMILSGQVQAKSMQYDEGCQRVVGELAGIEKRLGWLYEQLPAGLAAYHPLPPGPLGRRLHARRAELLGALDDAFSKTHSQAGANALGLVVSSTYPGAGAVSHAATGWVTITDAIRNGAILPEGFVEDWAAIVPAACDQFAEWSELAVWVLRVS